VRQITCFNHLVRCIKKQNIPQDTAWKALQFTYDRLFYICSFSFQNDQILSYWFSILRKWCFFGRRCIHFCLFHIFITWYLLFKENKIHHRMQREKLYNLQSKAHFNYLLLVSKKSKILCNQFLLPRKTYFFSIWREISFFLLDIYKVNCSL
jgi:hypothetical protein